MGSGLNKWGKSGLIIVFVAGVGVFVLVVVVVADDDGDHIFIMTMLTIFLTKSFKPYFIFLDICFCVDIYFSTTGCERHNRGGSPLRVAFGRRFRKASKQGESSCGFCSGVKKEVKYNLQITFLNRV